MGYSNLPLSTAISPVLLSLVNMGSLADRLYFPFANHLLCITGSLLLFSVRVPAANFGRGRFLCLFGLALRLFDFLGAASLFLLSSIRELIANLN